MPGVGRVICSAVLSDIILAAHYGHINSMCYAVTSEGLNDPATNMYAHTYI